jgi:hypothetical protein
MNMNMMYGRSQRSVNTFTNINGSPSTNLQLMKLKYNKQYIPVNLPSPESNVVVNESTIVSNGMKWGKPTWYFLHTLAEKVNENKFPEIRKELLEIIYSICTNLPCPDCSNHAKAYLDKINFNTIQTKNDLKNMLFVFHNTVNTRKSYPIFTLDELNSKYLLANTSNIFNAFFTQYLAKTGVPKMIANDMFRRRIFVKIKDWINKNIYYFSS